MAYRVILDRTAAKILDHLEARNHRLFKQIIERIDLLPFNPFLGKSLIGDKKGYYSLRVSDYRIIYSVNHTGKIIVVLDISHRREVYR